MKKYVVMNASVEMTRERYLKEGGYREYITGTNDWDQERLAVFDTQEEAKKFLNGKTSSINPYPSNGIVVIEEYYVDEYQYDENKEIDEDDDLFDFADLMGCDYVAPLDENSRKFVKDIYPEEIKMKYEELKEEYERLHEELVESYAITDDCGWTQEKENELYLTHASSYHRQYLYDDDPDFLEDLEELIRRVKKAIEDNKKYLPQNKEPAGRRQERAHSRMRNGR